MADLIAEPARVLLAILIVLNVAKIISQMVLEHQLPYTRGVKHLWVQGSIWMPWIPFVLVLVALLACWYVGLWPYSCAFIVIGMVYWIRRQSHKHWPSDVVKDLGQYSPSAAAFMVLVGSEFAREYLGLGDDQTGWHVANGVVGYAWMMCGAKKLQESGWAWVHAHNIALLLAERLYLGHPIRRSVTRWLVSQPKLLVCLGFFGIAVELLGVLFFVPELRMSIALAILSLMVLNYLVWGFVEIEWGLVGVAVALGGTV